MYTNGKDSLLGNLETEEPGLLAYCADGCFVNVSKYYKPVVIFCSIIGISHYHLCVKNCLMVAHVSNSM